MRTGKSNLRTVIAIVITSNLELARSPGNVLLSSRKTGLPKDSVANVSQVLTIDKSFLTERIGSIPGNLQDEIDEGLRMILYL
jgi:mRNA interferase MazF